jgi:hypothetical protein
MSELKPLQYLQMLLMLVHSSTKRLNPKKCNHKTHGTWSHSHLKRLDRKHCNIYKLAPLATFQPETSELKDVQPSNMLLKSVALATFQRETSELNDWQA